MDPRRESSVNTGSGGGIVSVAVSFDSAEMGFRESRTLK
jgi:hypothetical protein